MLNLHVAAPGDIEEIDHVIPPDGDDAALNTPTLHRAQVGVARPPRRIHVERPCDVDGACVFELDLHAARLTPARGSRKEGAVRPARARRCRDPAAGLSQLDSSNCLIPQAAIESRCVSNPAPATIEFPTSTAAASRVPATGLRQFGKVSARSNA